VVNLIEYEILNYDYNINTETENELIKVQHDAGFFSVCNINLKTVIGYYSNNHKFCSLDTSEQWNWYKDEPIDVYSKFFKFDKNEFSISPQNFSDSNDEDQFSDYRLINYDFVSPFVKKYFSFSDEVKEIEKNLIQKYNIDLNNTISVCYRGNDKIKETNLPTYEEIEEQLNNLLLKYPNKKVIIQSDELEFCDFMSQKNDNFIIFDEIEKISKTPYAAIQYTIPIGRKIENAQTFLAIMSIISKSEYVILNSGNVGLWVCLFRGDSKKVFQYINHKGSDNPIWINCDEDNKIKTKELNTSTNLKLNHFFQEIDGWSEIERQGVLLDTILNEIDTNNKINIAEIGVYKGRGTSIWNVILINNEINYDYYAIDNFLGSSEHQKNVNYYDITYRNLQPIIDKIKIIKNDSLEESKKYEDNFFDIVYIDASHDYESVTLDIKHWYPKVKKGGFICGDDYTDIWTDVKKSVQDFFGDNFNVVGETQWYSKK
jgi:predicted O-methyltransferase YrrM